jgi:hypothetical protein
MLRNEANCAVSANSFSLSVIRVTVSHLRHRKLLIASLAKVQASDKGVARFG